MTSRNQSTDGAGVSDEQPAAVFTPARFDAVLFDLDGVLTSTAKVHAACWKRMFDDFLQGRSTRTGEPFRPFDADSDYKQFVDGKPRYDGVRSFLASRGIALPEGTPDAQSKMAIPTVEEVFRGQAARLLVIRHDPGNLQLRQDTRYVNHRLA